MRRRIAWLVAATTSAVVLAFVIPLGLLVRTLAEDRALAGAGQDVQQVATYLVGSRDPADPQATASLQQFVTIVDDRSPWAVGVLLPDGTRVGDAVPPEGDGQLAGALEGRAAVDDDHGDGAVVLLPVVVGDGTAVVAADVPPEQLRAGVVPAWLTLGVLGLGMLVLAVVVADRLGRWVSTPVSAVAATARRLRDGDLDARVDPDGPPEVEALGRSLNRLADRVVELLALEREQAADLSHRLRTPVTALRLDVDQIEDPQVAQRLRGHVDSLVRTVDQVVADARRPVKAGVESRCDAAQVVRERVEFWSALAQDQERDVGGALDPGPLWVAADAVDLADAMDALLDNVFAHTPDGTDFAVHLRAVDGGGARVEVADAGPGLPSGDLAERGRSGAGSSGLGTDIARRVAVASGGALELGRSAAGGASVVLLLGPAAT
jgi:signal transduction histidine kinase